MKTASLLFCHLIFRCMLAVIVITNLCFAAEPSKTQPDLTQDRAVDRERTYNLGATGLRGWIHTKPATYLDGLQGRTTAASRQILVTHVGAKSPADGVMQVDDVILGVGGKAFEDDARKSFARAIQDAEKESNGGMLKVTRWRAGKTEEVQLKLRVMGTYSATAPYDCPKSKKIFDEACVALAKEPLPANWHGAINGLALLATGNDEHRPALQKLAQEISSQAGKSDPIRMGTWENGYRGIFLCEYYLATGDSSVLPAINAITVSLARGQSMFGTFGHGYAELTPDGKLHGSIPPYGPVNQAGLPANLAIVLGKKCGVLDEEVNPAIERASKFFGYFVDKGTIPYGEHEPWPFHDNNGKSAMSAVLFGLQDNKFSEAQFFAKMTVASYRSRECGHTGQGFSYLWGALGANVGGPDAAAAFFKESSWHLDLVRRSDGSFTYDGGEQFGPGKTEDNTYYGKSSYFGLSPNATYVLSYSLPLKKLLLTGKELSPGAKLAKPEVEQAVTSGRFDTDRKTKTLPELMEALGDWSPIVRGWAAEEITARPDGKTLIPELLKLAEGSDKHRRQGACETLANMRSPEALPILIRMLSDDDRWLRFKAAQGIGKYGSAAKPVLTDILKAVAKTRESWQPINWADPVQLTHGQLAAALFSSSLTDSLKGVDGELLYPAIRAIASNADGMARAKLRGFFENKLSVDDVQALAPDIYAAVKTPSPADTMFGNEIRMGGFKALTKYNFEEGIELGVLFAKTQGGHGSENRTGVIMKEIAKYGTAAKPAIPELKELIAQFNAECDRREYPKGELNDRRVNAVQDAIKAIEAATDHPELRSIKRSIKSSSNQQYRDWKHSGSMWLLTTPEGADLPADAKVEQFPVLVRLHRDWFDFTQAKPNGDDLRFSSSTGERLAFQIEEWDAAKGVASVWVRVPLITGNSRQEIKLHWGNANAASESEGKAVFNESNGYLSVWHMNDPVRDDTGTLTSTDTGTTATAGVIGAARHFADRKGVFGGDKIESLPTGSNSHSTEVWFRPEKPNSTLIGWGNEQGQGKVVMQYRSPPHIRMDCYFSGGSITGTNRVPTGDWTHVVHTYRDGESRLYVNGVLDGTNITKGGPLNIRTPARLFIGGWYHNYDFVGDLDEVRVSKVVRSAEWVKLQFENQKPNQSLAGALVQPGNEFSVSQSQLVVGENQNATITAKAGGAQKVLWILKRDGRESIVATDRFAYAFNAGRVSSFAPQKNGAKGDNGLSATLTVKAIYANEVKTKDIAITISDDIPEPVFTLTAPAKWNGRETIEVVPQISNLAAMQSKGAGDVNVTWTVDDVAVIKRIEAGKLILKRAQGIGAMRVTAAIDNGGAKVSQSITIAVQEPPPSKDAWVQRPLADVEQPEDNQFIPRDGPNRGGPQFGTLVYAGTLADAADAVFVRVFADDQPFATETARLGADKKYSLSVKLDLGLIKYRTEFGSKTGDKETVLHTAKNIVCGDAYLIIGQSNAVANDFGKENPLVPSEWVRTFGATAGDPNGSRLKLWANAEARSPGGKSEIGFWGMELGRRLVESMKIPICFINGAVGGTRIDQHQRNDADPTEVNTIYGRQLWRVQQAKLTHGIRAVIWHQGENDQGADGPTGGYGYETYRQYFVDLAASWKEDYPNIQHYYAFQIWPKSCAMGINGSDNRLREVQRTLPKLFSNMSVISTLGIKPPGGCHYPAAGYAEFARFLHPMMGYHLYHRHVDSFNPPNIQRAFFTSAQRDELVLEFDYHINWSDSLVSQFHLDGEPKQVVAGSANGSRITLKLKGPTKSKTVTYLDSAAWNPDNLLYGQNGLAALTFCDVPIEPSEGE